MKKLALVITQSELGGAQKHLLLLAQYLKTDFQITVYSAPGGKLVEHLKNLNIKYIPVESLVREINLLEDYKAYNFLKTEFKKENYDIVHCHSSKAGVVGRLAASKAGIKNIIYTAHGFVFNEPMSNVKKIIYELVERYIAKFSNNIICVSELDLKIAKAKDITPKNKLVYIPNGIEFFQDENQNNKIDIRGKLNLNKDEFIFGLVANFYATKGHKYLVAAFNSFINEGYKAKLVFVGDGELRNEIELLGANNPNIIFLGFREDAPKIVQAFDCFVMSSVKEGFPFALLEAIQNIVPIISTDVGAVVQILDEGKGGIIVPPQDSNAIKNSMIFAFSNKEKIKSMANYEYNFCKSKYSIESMINKTKNIYEENM